MKNSYLSLKHKQEEEFNAFPMVFAFNDKQFKEAMQKLGLTEADTDKVYKVNGGGLYRKTDAEALREMGERHSGEMAAAIEADETGEDFIFDMFAYELANHEYSYTWEIDSTLSALGLTREAVAANKKLAHGLEKAKKYVSDNTNL